MKTKIEYTPRDEFVLIAEETLAKRAIDPCKRIALVAAIPKLKKGRGCSKVLNYGT